MAHKANSLGKPIFAPKVGSSKQVQAGSLTQTASIGGSDVGARALLKRLDIGQVVSLLAVLGNDEAAAPRGSPVIKPDCVNVLFG